MWFGKDIMTKLGLVLAMAVPALAADVAPLTFSGVSDPVTMQKYWDELMSFKMWGTKSIDFHSAELTDVVGAIGTTGNMTLGNARQYLGGPIYVGGSVSGSTSQDQFTSGPGRIKGKLSMSDNNSKLVGTYCIEGSVNENVEQARQAGGATLQVGASATSGDCAYDNIKDVPLKLVIPDYPTDYAGAIELGAVSVPNGDFNYTIDIPPIEYDKETGEIVKKMYDFHLSSLTFGNDCKLIIRMQSQKSLARFFVTGPLSLTAGTTIQVAYADENATYNWSTHKWESETFEDVSLEDYKGNLLFYTTEGFEMPAMHGTAFIQGSFMSKGKIKVGSNLTLAGQFLAEAIETDNELDGKSFKYVPFDPPILKIEPEVGTEFLFPELSSWEKVPIKLDKAPVTDVKFDYCFEYLDKSSFGKPVAEPADLIINGGHPFPLCSKNEKGSVEFVTGQRTPKDDAHSVWINVKMDGVPEDEREALRLNISGLQGAVMPNGKDAGSFILYLIDGDTDPQSKDAAFTVDEDEYYVLSSKEFYFESKKHFAQEGVTIMSIPEKGFLVYRGDTLTAGGQFISMDDLGKDYLKFIAKKDDFSGEDVYTTFKFTVRDVGDPDNNIPQGTSDEYTVSITVSPVNDEPFAHDTLFTIAEHSTSGDVAEGFIQVDDVDDSRFTFAFDKKDKSYDAVNALYVIDEYGRISVKKDVVLNYETVDSILTIAVKVTDAASTTNGEGAQIVTSNITIKILDLNERPDIHDTTLAVDENAVAGTPVGKVTTDDEDVWTKFTYSLADVTEDDPVASLFTIDADGLITVAEGAKLDFEERNEYQIWAIVKDNGESMGFAEKPDGEAKDLYDTALVTITINDVNEKPEFFEVEDIYNVVENFPENILFAKVLVFDPDAKDLKNLSVTLTDKDKVEDVTSAEDLFSVAVVPHTNADSSKKGFAFVTISVKNTEKLNYEALYADHFDATDKDVHFNVTLTLTDKDGESVPVDTKIRVDDVNEAPTIENAEFAVKENSDIGSTVGVMEVSDPDMVVDDPEAYNAAFRDLVYTIVEEDKDVPFVMDSNVVKVNGALDHEGSVTYTFKVAVTDKNDETLTDTATVTVTVENVNETPVLDCLEDDENCEGPFKIEENSPTGTTIHKFAVSDVDGGDELTLSLEDTLGRGAENLFDVKFNDDLTQMEVFVKDGKKLDYEEVDPSYVVRLIVTDKGLLADTLVRVIEVIDVNEAPSIKNATFSIAEDAKQGDEAGKVSASDPDSKTAEYRELVYTIVEEDKDVPFVMDSNVVKVNGALDHEGVVTYTFRVAVSDKYDPKLTDTATVTVTIDNVNETPKLDCLEDDDNCEGPFKIEENSPTGTTIHNFAVSDVDAGDKLTLSLEDTLGRGAESLFDVKFNDDKTQMVVFVKDGKKLDYEKVDPSYVVRLIVTDKGLLADTLVRTIEVIDVNEAPTIENADFAIKENSDIGSTVGVMEVSDPDKVVEDPEAYNAAFRDLVYTIVEEDKDVPFVMDSNEVKVNGALDHEGSATYTFKVAVSDKNDPKLTDTATVTVTIDNVNETPVLDCLEDDENCDGPFKIEENSPTGTPIHNFAVSDVDAGDVLTLTLEDTLGRGAESLFEVKFNDDKTQMVVFVKDGKKLDYEKVDPSYVVRLIVTDKGLLADTLVRTIEVIDVNELQVVDDATFDVDENSTVGTNVGTLVVTDPDTKNPEFRQYTYKVVDENVPFTMNADTVVVSGSIDFEGLETYTFKVAVTDKLDPTLTDTADVTVKINDVDERPKIIVDDDDDGDDDTDSLCIAHCEVDSIDRGSHGKNIVTVGVKENSPIGTVVFEYYVYDEDADDVAKLVPTLEQMSTVGTYSDGPTSNDLFEITKKKVGKDRWKIVVTVKDSIDYETLRNAEKNKDPNPQYKVAVVVTDTLDPKNPKSKALSDTIIRVIEIQDVNETPTFVVWPCIIEEHNEIGDSIGHVEHGSDVDSLSPIDKFYKDNRYELIGGDTTLFGLDTNGDVIAKVVFNCEDTTAMGERVYVCGDSTVYSIDIAYFDKNDTTLKLTRHVPITLIDVNEDPWIVTDSISVAEHVKKGTVVDTIVAKDKDLYDSVLTFTLVEDNSGCFQVSKKGVVTVKADRCAALDYETNKVLPIKVKVTDTKNASETQTVYVKVEDVNEPPSIKDQEIHVSEDAKVNTVIGKVVATDPDIDPKYTTLNYTIISGDSTVFKINPKTGEITLKDTLDYETKKQYKIKVRVDDSEFADTATVTIKVDNVVETSTVIITKFDNPDTTINYPDTVYTNQPDGVISWRQDDDILSMDTTFKPGKNVIVISYKDPTKDKGAKDTIVVMYSNASPVVTVSGDVDAVVAENVYTIVEKTDKADTNLYVNERSKDIRVTVKDPANKTDTSFVVSLALESVEVPQKTLDAVGKIAKGGVVVDVTRKGSVRTPVNGTEIKVSYKEIIGKDTVTVSYMTDNDGEPVKVAVINAKGKVDSIEVMTVSYNTVIDGKTVTVSYQADAVTGEVLVKDSNGALMVSGASKSSNSSSSKKGNSSSSTSDGGKGRVTEGMFQITYNTEDALGNSTTISYSVDEKGNVVQNAEGDIGYSVAYTYTNVYGNSATQSVFIVLDQVGPKVEILTPEYGEIIHSNYVKVKWAVNGIEQDTLNMQGLVKGTNYVVRFFRDKAGNEVSDTVLVMMKDGKDVDISVEQPVTEVSKEQVDEYYAINPPEEGQNFAVSIRNPSTGKEYETLKGIGSKTKQGSGKEPYPGASGSAHLGPTLALDVHLPTVNAVGGLATLDDLIASDGMITLEGVDAKNGTKVSVQEYVEQYCEEDFELPSDLSQVNLYDSKMIIKVWIYTNLGGFVDYYTFTQDMNDPSFTNDAGMLQMFFEQKVDKDGFVRDQDGKLYATGAYLYKVEATIRSTLRCTLPSEDYDAKTGSFGLNAKKMGDRVKSSDDLLKPFGYKRPSEK